LALKTLGTLAKPVQSTYRRLSTKKFMNSSLMTSLALKTTGLVLIISTFVDLIFGILPYRFDDVMWWSAATAVMVKSGLLSLMGIILWVLADWIETVSKDGGAGRSGVSKLIVSAYSLFFGVVFLFITPFQAWSSNNYRDKIISSTSKELSTTEATAKERTSADALKKKIAEIDAALKDKKNQSEPFVQQMQAQKAQLEQFVKDPSGLTKQIEKELAPLREKKKAIDEQATADLWRGSEKTGGIRTSLSSLLLAASYGFIGLMGLRTRKR
jgi:hypothetical protein